MNTYKLFVCSSISFEVIVIDDNSPDGTQEVVKKLQELYGQDKIVSLPPNGFDFTFACFQQPMSMFMFNEWSDSFTCSF